MGVAANLPADLAPFGREETFDPGTLSDKIDGKADLYLSTGFVELTVRRFAKKTDAKSWIELSVYQMRDSAGAFSVYSLQKRKDSKPLNLASSGGGDSAYRTADAIFFAAGPKYFEITSSAPGLMGDMKILAINLVKGQPRSGGLTIESFFPHKFLDRSTISLHMKDVFSMSGLDRVYTAVYTDRGCQVTAFISRRKSPKEAEDIAAAYGKFLLENGGVAAGEMIDAPGAKIYKVFDTYEVVMHRGAFFAGAHEVDKLESAKDVALRVYRKISEVVR
ncbi:MAG: hypothetical protein P4L43_08485 [Syntrophobacteraceae bacterium]|nr:hypothetical protein [Syntrophobacteraceae bacterium]